MKKLFFILFAFLMSYLVSGQTEKEISRSWLPFSQTIQVETDSIKRFKVVASVKVDTKDQSAWAGVWARVDNKPDQGRGFFDNMSDRPIKINTWKVYMVEGTIDAKSEKLSFGGICLNNGKFYFDKFELYLEDDFGNYQPVNIGNHSFEEKVVNNLIPQWVQRISKEKVERVKEFSLNSSNEKVDGAYSLLIEGKGISKKTGSIEASSPNLGMYIGLLIVLIFMLTLITSLSSMKDKKWSNIGRFGFRFSFIYFLLIIIFQNNGAYPYFYYLMEKPMEWMQKFTLWFGESIVGVPYKINVGQTGSGDTTYDYLVVLIVFLIAIIGALIWSILDRKRKNYDKLYYWLTTGLRYYVGLMLISYGLVKVIQLQFPSPGFYRLFESYGESSPMGLAWTFLGFSKGYNLFMGIAEVLAGLLLFRRTMTLGAIITLMTTMNVMAVNYFFDVPVKLLSTHLVLMTLFLLSRDIKKVLQFLLTNKPVAQLTVISRPKLKKALNISLNVFKGLIIAYALGYGFYNALGSQKKYGSEALKPELYGAYEVTDFVINGDTITNYKNKKLWKTISVQREGSLQVRKFTKPNAAYYGVEKDSVNNKLKLTGWGSGGESFYFNFKKIDSVRYDFDFISKGDTINGSTKRLDKNDFLLTNRGFNWISEYPFNR